MSGRPLKDQRCDDVLPREAPSTAPTLGSSVGNVKPWSPSSIASSIIDTLTGSNMWCPRGKNNSNSKEIKGDEGDMGSKKVESMDMLRDTHSTDNVGSIEYTSEHLEKALIELKSSGIIDGDLKPAVVVASRTVIQVEQKNASSETIDFKTDMEITTVVAYPVNLNQSNQEIGVKPEVTDISTQSTMDRVRLNTQTTTDDLPTPPSSPKSLSNAETSPETEMDSERPIRKSKVPILKPGHSLPSSSTSINKKAPKCNSNPKVVNSKIPLKTPTASKESIPSKSALRSTKNEKICCLSPRKAVRNIAAQESSKIQNELPNLPKEDLESSNTKVGIAIPLQTEELSSCGEQTKEERSQGEIDLMRKHLLDNMQMVENVLNSLPRDDLGKLYGEYVLGRHVSTMTDDLQVSAFTQCDDKEDEENRKLYEDQVYKGARLVSVIDIEAIDSTTSDVKPMDEGENEADDDDEYEDIDETSEETIFMDKVVSKHELKPKVTQPTAQKSNRVQSSIKKSKTDLIGHLSVKESKMAIADTSSIPKRVEVNKSMETKDSQEKKKEKAKDEVVRPAQVAPSKAAEKVIVKKKPKEEPKRNVTEDIRKVTKEDIAYEVNVFNMIQSQKINNILRLAMPYNNILLPVFVSAPSAIMLSLEKELRHTMEIKRQASVYFNGLIARSSKSNTCQRLLERKSSINNCINKRNVAERKKQLIKVTRCASYGTVIGPTIIAQNQATWAKPPFYYGSYKKIPAK